MKRILRWKDKHSDCYWDISTPEQELAAYLKMFELVDEFYGYPLVDGKQESNDHIREVKAEIELLRELKKSLKDGKVVRSLRDDAKQKLSCLRNRERELEELLFQKNAYTKAKQGDSKAAKLLIDARSSYEYETTFIENVLDPLTED